MAYKLSAVTIRTNNSETGMKMIEELWGDVSNGTLPILFDNEHNFQPGISPVFKYSNYETDDTGDYDLSILGVEADFFRQLEAEVSQGCYKKYDASDEKGDLGVCTKKAWERVWEEQRMGELKRAFTTDYESTVPAQYTKDGAAHCYLYIAVQH